MKLDLTHEQTELMLDRIEAIDVKLIELSDDNEENFGKILYLDMEKESLEEALSNTFIEIE